MKKAYLRVLLCSLLAAMLLFSAAAAETDAYGYYDYNEDGKAEIVDVLSLLNDKLNTDADIPLLRVIRALKASADSTVIKGTVTAAEEGILTVTANKIAYAVPASSFGLHAAEDLASFINFPATVSLSASDASKTYAAKVDREGNTVISVTAGSKTAYINGEAATLDVAPFVADDTLLVPARFVAESLGTTIAWEQATKTAILEKDSTRLEMQMDNTAVTVNGKAATAPVAATIVDNRTYLPFAFVAETFGMTAQWNGDAQTVTVIDYAKALLYAEKITAKAGDTVTVPLFVKNCPGIAGLQFSATYDSAVLSYTKSAGGNSGMYTSCSAAGANPVKVALANLNLKNKYGSFTVVSLTFTVAETAAAGECRIWIDNVNAYDKDVVELPMWFTDIALTIE